MVRPRISFCTVKRLFTKCRDADVSEFQVLLGWRNTPSEGMDTSPARLKTLLQTSGPLLMPEFSLDNDAAKLCARKDRQRRYFNREERILCPLKDGKIIRVRSPTKTWKPAECLREVAPRSYKVLVVRAVHPPNRKDIWRTAQRPNTGHLRKLSRLKGLLLRHQVLIMKLLWLTLKLVV